MDMEAYMELDVKKELMTASRDAAKEAMQRKIQEEVLQVQNMDITRAAAAMLEANVEVKLIESLLCKYWDLRPSEAYKFIRDGEDEQKM